METLVCALYRYVCSVYSSITMGLNGRID